MHSGAVSSHWQVQVAWEGPLSVQWSKEWGYMGGERLL
jgi:hypothetical protein